MWNASDQQVKMGGSEENGAQEHKQQNILRANTAFYP